MHQEALHLDFGEEDGEVHVIEWGSEDCVDSFFGMIFKAESSPCPPPTSCHLLSLLQSRGLDAVSFREPRWPRAVSTEQPSPERALPLQS